MAGTVRSYKTLLFFIILTMIIGRIIFAIKDEKLWIFDISWCWRRRKKKKKKVQLTLTVVLRRRNHNCTSTYTKITIDPSIVFVQKMSSTSTYKNFQVVTNSSIYCCMMPKMCTSTYSFSEPYFMVLSYWSWTVTSTYERGTTRRDWMMCCCWRVAIYCLKSAVSVNCCFAKTGDDKKRLNDVFLLLLLLLLLLKSWGTRCSRRRRPK